MLRYISHRVLLMLPTLIGVAVLVFLVLRVVPGDIVEVKLTADGGMFTEEQIQTNANDWVWPIPCRCSSCVIWAACCRVISVFLCGPSVP